MAGRPSAAPGDEHLGQLVLHEGRSDKYREVSDAIGAENYCPWGPSVGDLNADGFDDAFIASGMNYPERYMINSVKLNDRGQKFVDAEFVLGVEPRSGGLATPWFELDASGKDEAIPMRRAKTGRVQMWGARASRSAVILDVDGDGDLDIVTNEFNAAPMVLISNLSERTPVHYIAVKLVGTTSNRDGLGAIVKVTAGGRPKRRCSTATRDICRTACIRCTSAWRVLRTIDSIEVTWPRGRSRRFRYRSRSIRRSK